MFHHLGSNEVSLRRNQHVRLTLLPPDGCSEILPPSGEGREQNIGELLVGLASLPYLPTQPPLEGLFLSIVMVIFHPTRSAARDGRLNVPRRDGTCMRAR